MTLTALFVPETKPLNVLLVEHLLSWLLEKPNAQLTAELEITEMKILIYVNLVSLLAKLVIILPVILVILVPLVQLDISLMEVSV